MKILFARLSLAATLLAFSSTTWAGDHVFDSSFDDHAEGPWSAADAAGGFLTGLGFTGLGWLWPFALPPLAAIVAFLATRRAGRHPDYSGAVSAPEDMNRSSRSLHLR